MVSPVIHSLNFQAPVPTGLMPKLTGSFCTAVGDGMLKYALATLPSSGENGAVSTNLTVFASMTVTSFSGPTHEAVGVLVLGSSTRSKANLTASALNGVPSWKL